MSQSVALVVGVCIGVAIAFFFVHVAFLRPGCPSVYLESQVNPNTASVGSLVRLPGIGLTRARAIVAHREQFAEQRVDRVAFEEPGDLQEIRGIGPKTVEGLTPWLRFDGSPNGTWKTPESETAPH